MDNTILAAQYAQSGDLMDLCNNETWLRESASIEDEGQVEAGLVMRKYSQVVSILTSEQTQQLRQQMKIQSILFTALRQWMESWNLGAGFDATYASARRLIRYHLANLNPTHQAAFEKLLGENAGMESMNELTRQQVITMLSEFLTPGDWQAMAEAASHSIALQVLSAKQTQPETTVV